MVKMDVYGYESDIKTLEEIQTIYKNIDRRWQNHQWEWSAEKEAKILALNDMLITKQNPFRPVHRRWALRKTVRHGTHDPAKSDWHISIGGTGYLLVCEMLYRLWIA